MMASPTKKKSQFAGAAALFQQKEKEVLEKQGSLKGLSPQPSPMTKFGNSSLNHHASLYSSPMKQSSINNHNRGKAAGASSLAPPPFVSPGGNNAGRSSWNHQKAYPSPSYLDKPSGMVTPSTSSKPKVSIPSPSGFSFSPSPTSKPKVNTAAGSSWRDRISFQATSPGALAQNKKSVTAPPISPGVFGGSYLKHSTTNTNNNYNSRSSTHSTSSTMSNTSSTTTNNNNGHTNYEDVADIAIEVRIPDIEQKIKARKRASQLLQQQQQQKLQQSSGGANVPEWQIKFQQREANRIRKENERQEQSATLLQATIRRFIARATFPRLLEDNADRLQAMRDRERLLKARQRSAILIQSIFRMYLPRKRYVYVRECRRRRQANEQEMKRIAKVIKGMPKRTKADIKDMKKEYAEKKKQLKKKLKQTLKEDDKKLAAIAASGKSMIDYLQGENKKLQEQKVSLAKDYSMLEKQTDLLNQKSDEIARNFMSLKQFVDKKHASIQKYEINSQKCRQRYLPKYRAMLKERDRHCLAERHIAALYRQRLEQIVEMLSDRSTSTSLVFDAKEALAACQLEVESLPELPIPESLQDRW